MSANGQIAPAQRQLQHLDSVFGPEYFETGRLVLTVARDLPGLMKVAHKLQAKINEGMGTVVEVIMEHVKHEYWLKLHETTTIVGLQKGAEVPDVQVTHIPDGIREHPYKRPRLPTLEVLFLWEDITGVTQGHCLYTVAHPELPTLAQVDNIFSQISPYFAKRWIDVELRLAPPMRGEFDEVVDTLTAAGQDCLAVGGGVAVTILACHADGFARDQSAGTVAHVTRCQPIVFHGISDERGIAKLCFLPADVNKIQIAETEGFYGTETLLPKAKMQSPVDGPTVVSVELTPKAMAVVTVHILELPKILPSADDTDGIIDWASEDTVGLTRARVEMAPMKDGLAPVALRHVGDGCFVAEGSGLPEGCVTMLVECPGYEQEERALFLLVGANEFWVPLRKLR